MVPICPVDEQCALMVPLSSAGGSCQLLTVGNRAFSVAGPRMWNPGLPEEIISGLSKLMTRKSTAAVARTVQHRFATISVLSLSPLHAGRDQTVSNSMPPKRSSLHVVCPTPPPSSTVPVTRRTTIMVTERLPSLSLVLGIPYQTSSPTVRHRAPSNNISRLIYSVDAL